MSLAVDEYGNPFVVLREQDQRKRLKGLDAHKANILAAKSIANTLRTSLGPKGMDKIIVSPDGDVTVTNDGATILSKMEVEHQCARLLVELSNSQDDEIGDGTTGVVILAGALLDQSLLLLEKGIHPLRIGESFEIACDIAIKRLSEVAKELPIDTATLRSAAATALGSKVVSAQQEKIADLAVSAVMSVADLERKDANFDLIKIEGKAGGQLEESTLVHGIVIDKELSHSQMPKVTTNARIAILTCPFEPPKPKTKHKLDIKTVEDYQSLQRAEQEYFRNMVAAVKNSGANFVICQWGFDDEANHLLLQNELPSVRWVGGVELELIAIATGGRIVARFEDLKPEALGQAGSITEVSTGTQGGSQMIFIEGCGNTKAVTVVLRGGNQMVVDEAKRCFHDAICCVRNVIRDNRILPGGGAAEIAASIAVETAADKIESVHQYGVRAFSEALMAIPEALADNAGLDAISTTADARARQIRDGTGVYGIDVNQGVADMMSGNVWETVISKINQVQLATQVVRMILKIDDVIVPSEMQFE